MTPPKSKTTISLDRDVLSQVKAAVGEGRAPSVSAYIEHAIRCQLAAETEFDVTIAELLNSTGGSPTDEERAAARRLLSGNAA